MILFTGGCQSFDANRQRIPKEFGFTISLRYHSRYSLYSVIMYKEGKYQQTVFENPNTVSIIKKVNKNHNKLYFPWKSTKQSIHIYPQQIV